MIDLIIQTADSILFIAIFLMTAYLFVFALAALFRRTDRYPETQKRHRFAILVPEETKLCEQEYPAELYETIISKDFPQTVRDLDENKYDLVVRLGSGSQISPQFIEQINRAYEAGATAIQLRHIADQISTRKLRWQAIDEEIRQSIFYKGAIRLGFSSALSGWDMVLELSWLKKNLKSNKSNLERRLSRQSVFIEYLEYIHVHSVAVRKPLYRVKRKKALTSLSEALLSGNWDYCNKIIRWLMPSWKTLVITTTILFLLIAFYDWVLMIKWGILLFALLFAICLAIPDYLVEDNKKKKEKKEK